MGLGVTFRNLELGSSGVNSGQRSLRMCRHENVIAYHVARRILARRRPFDPLGLCPLHVYMTVLGGVSHQETDVVGPGQRGFSKGGSKTGYAPP